MQWAALSPIPFVVVGPEDAAVALPDADFLVIDSERRPSVEDLAELAATVEVVLIPCGPSRLELQSGLALWRALKARVSIEAVRLILTRTLLNARAGMDARDALRAAGVQTLHSLRCL